MIFFVTLVLATSLDLADWAFSKSGAPSVCAEDLTRPVTAGCALPSLLEGNFLEGLDICG